MTTLEDVKNPLDDYVTINEAAEFLRCGKGQVYKLGKVGRLTVVKFIGRRFVLKKSLEDLINEEFKQ